MSGVLRRFFRLRLAALAPLAVIALAGCGPSAPPEAVNSVEERDGTLIAFAGYGAYPSDPRPAEDGWVSHDGGRTWTATVSEPEVVVHTSACVSGYCYRVVPGRLAVEQSADGGSTFRPAWSIPPERVELLERALDTARDESLRSRAVAVQKRPSGRHVVAVANGSYGLTVRDETGVWRRYTVDGDGELRESAAMPSIQPGELIGQESAAAVLAGLWALTVGFFLAAADRRARKTLGVLAGIGTAGAVFSLGILTDEPLLALLGVLGTLTGAVVALVAWAVAATSKLGGPAITRAVSSGLAVSIAVLAPFWLWSAGWLASYGGAAVAAVVLGLAAAVTGLTYVRRRRAG
ncbi:hypothetical protein [Thermoactinospora rubra]|uniref:hypothetical protein n=1 Tax=Thermoactinospora rubra TaxID=1088767 RepID=UPI000A0F4A3D|nr:hypothetical protein [Thermoactinospora rubra]